MNLDKSLDIKATYYWEVAAALHHFWSNFKEFQENRIKKIVKKKSSKKFVKKFTICIHYRKLKKAPEKQFLSMTTIIWDKGWKRRTMTNLGFKKFHSSGKQTTSLKMVLTLSFRTNFVKIHFLKLPQRGVDLWKIMSLRICALLAL